MHHLQHTQHGAEFDSPNLCRNLLVWSTVCTWHAANGNCIAPGVHAWSALTGLMNGAVFRSYQLLSVASGHVNKGASQVTVKMQYKGRPVHRQLIDCKFSAICACAEESWPVPTAIDYYFTCSDMPFDTEVCSIDCQAMTKSFRVMPY